LIALVNIAGLAFWALAVVMLGEIRVRGGVLGLLFGLAVTALALRGFVALTRRAPARL
jgi:hypothetical protein